MNKILNLLLGIVFLILGVHVIWTGEIRSVVILGNEKYLLGSVGVVFGFYVLFQELKKK